VAVIAGVMMPVIVLAVGLWVETGYWYQQQRSAQHAADVAAFAAGVRIRAGDTAAAYTAAARYSAVQAGVNLTAIVGTTTAPVAVNFPYNNTDANRVEVVVTQDLERYLTGIFASSAFRDWWPGQFPEKVRVRGRAVVKLVGREATSGCVLALSRTATGALSVAGNTTVALKGCDLASNSAHPTGSFTADGSAILSANCVRAVGGVSASSSNVSLAQGCPVPFAAPSRDPYANVKSPMELGFSNTGCTSEIKPATGSANNPFTVAAGSFNATVGANIRCFTAAGGGNGFIDLKTTVTFSAGVYVFNGSLRLLSGANVVADSGVTFYFTDGNTMIFNGGNALTITPPTASTNPWRGISIMADRATGTVENFQISGNNTISVQGAIYAPTSNVEYTGNSTTSTAWNDASSTNDGCTQIIASTVRFTGSSQLASDCQDMGTQPLYSFETVELDQ
jgi:hypothetical protein